MYLADIVDKLRQELKSSNPDYELRLWGSIVIFHESNSVAFNGMFGVFQESRFVRNYPKAEVENGIAAHVTELAGDLYSVKMSSVGFKIKSPRLSDSQMKEEVRSIQKYNFTSSSFSF